MAAVLRVAQVALFVPAAPRLRVSQVSLQVPTPPTGGTFVLRVSQVKLTAPAPPTAGVLRVSQVRLSAPLASGSIPYSGVMQAAGGNLTNVPVWISKDGQL